MHPAVKAAELILSEARAQEAIEPRSHTAKVMSHALSSSCFWRPSIGPKAFLPRGHEKDHSKDQRVWLLADSLRHTRPTHKQKSFLILDSGHLRLTLASILLCVQVAA